MEKTAKNVRKKGVIAVYDEYKQMEMSSFRKETRLHFVKKGPTEQWLWFIKQHPVIVNGIKRQK